MEWFADTPSQISIWRPLVGSNDDYPLALCDYTSIRPADDIVNNDDIHRDRVNGNSLLYRHEAHKWYYLKAQRPRDVLVFRNIDSTGKRARMLTSLSLSLFKPKPVIT